MRKNKHWTAEEEDYLAESWGVIKIPTIAEELGRTEIAVISKAAKMGLGHYYAAQGKLTANYLAIEVGVHVITVLNWIRKYGLKAIQKRVSKKRIHYQIDAEDFWKWAEQNQWRFDSKNLEPLVFGIEPEWMKEKRMRDVQLPRRVKKMGSRKGAWYTEEAYWQAVAEIEEKTRRSEAM
jgi:hypothetical protein